MDTGQQRRALKGQQSARNAQAQMNAAKEKQRFPSPDGASCSICLETVETAGRRSVARLKCSHVFHLDCIGSAFNAKGEMQCPNCRQVEGGQWLYSSGSLMQHEDFVRNGYARIQADMAYLRHERDDEGFDEAPRWAAHFYGQHVFSQGEEDSLINSYPYPTANERQHQGVPRYQTGGNYRLSNPNFDLGHAVPVNEMPHSSAQSNEGERPRHQDLRPSRTSDMYVQSLQPMLPRSHEQSSVNVLPELYSSHMLGRPGYRRQMNDDGYEEQFMYRWPVGRRHSIHREPSDMGIAVNLAYMHVLPDFGLQGSMSSLEPSNTDRRYGRVARRGGPYSPYVSNGLEDYESRSFRNGFDGHSSYFDNPGVIGMGRRIPQL